MIRRDNVTPSPATGGLTHRAGTVLFGGLFVAVGAAIVAVALGGLPGRMLVPAWVVASAGSVFVAGGGLVICEAFAVGAVFRKGVRILFVAALALPFHWTAFGPGEREISRTTSVHGVAHSAPASETGGRIAFGVGAVLLDLALLGLLVGALRRPRAVMDTPTVPLPGIAPPDPPLS
jgi:hypothetical protein